MSITAAAETETGLIRMVRGPLIVGLVSIAVLVVGFGGWAAIAPLTGGAIAAGIVNPDSSRQTVQHLEGGIIRSIHVRDGDTVEAGELLVTLVPIRAQASLGSQEAEWLRLLVIRARLEALDREFDEIVLPQTVLDALREGDLEDFVDAQSERFASRQATLEQEGQILGRQIAQLQSEIDSISADNSGKGEASRLLAEEIGVKQELYASQLINRSEVLALQRAQAELESAIAANLANIARAEQRIEEVRLNMLRSREQFRDEVATEMTEVNNRIAQIEEELVSSRDVLHRTEVRSPVDGTILNLRYRTTGGVVRPGDPILDIVPLDDDLIILARLSPRDIDLVYVGLEASVQLIPFASRANLPLSGEVTSVGADSLADEATGERYYEVRVTVSAEEMERHEGFYMTPGMPAEVIIVTGQRTMLEYLSEPIARSFRSAFVYD